VLILLFGRIRLGLQKFAADIIASKGANLLTLEDTYHAPGWRADFMHGLPVTFAKGLALGSVFRLTQDLSLKKRVRVVAMERLYFGECYGKSI
jgi:hypothetical protein